MANETEIKYLTPIAVETQRKKYCRFKKLGIKFDVRKVPTDSREDMDAIVEKARAELG